MPHNVKRMLAAVLCLSCLTLAACNPKDSDKSENETEAVTDGTVYEYSAKGKVLSAITYEGGGEMLLPDVEDRELLTALARATCAALPEKKPRKKPMKKE